MDRLSAEGVKFVKELIARIENLESEKRNITEDIKAEYTVAKEKGYDSKALRKVVIRRRKNPKEIENEEDTVQLYEGALQSFEPIT